MTEELRQQIKQFLKEEFADVIKKKLVAGHKLSSFNVNPFVITALSSGVLGEANSANIAKSLLYPRVFGTSINTNFGDKMQKLCTTYLDADASSTNGMDIEFNDRFEDQRVIMQLKAGPNTINSGDVDPIIEEMASAYRLLRQNRIAIMPTFAIGIAYGTIEDVSGHYKKIAASSVGGQMNIPLYVGQDFWHRLTGESDFYINMIKILVEVFEEEDCSELLESDIYNLAQEIEAKYFTDGEFDLNKI